jgi:leucyl-tRNA synthetase
MIQTKQPSNQNYDHQQVEPKWQAKWEEDQLFQDTIDQMQQAVGKGKKLDPMYLLFAFAYPSGSGLHVGHVESSAALDIMARYYRMQGKDVFFPVGWDAFGLPAENYAIKTGVHPEKTTKQAIKTFRRQIKRLGISYDWANELATCHPEYYQWTQWLFLKFFDKGLAYKKPGMVNWCPSCQTVLANEQVIDGLCERCETPVVQKDLEQWYYRITDYKDELIAGLDKLDWPNATKQHQINWIGRSEGAEIDLELADAEGKKFDQTVSCFTTRVDTVFGISFVVISPEKFEEFKLIEHVPDELKTTVAEYVDQAFHKTEAERRIGEKDKNGVDTGLQAINPVNGELVTLMVADYVLAGVGTGVVMGVPAHDQRDWEFARKHGLKIVPVIKPVAEAEAKNFDEKNPAKCTPEYGVMINSDAAAVGGRSYNGLTSKAGQAQLLKDFAGVMRTTVNYKLRDWLISRQRYWGAPIPIIYDPDDQPHPIKDKALPWLLPTDVDFNPTGESPLRSSKEFLSRTQTYAAQEYAELIAEKGWAKDGVGWTPEFDTMDTFVDSSWYYFRYLDSRNPDEFALKTRLKNWLPVNFYLIGPEHIVLHLLYSRFFTKFLRDEGYLDLPSGEPFAKMRHQGMILGPDHRKMSKSKGNVISPDGIVEKYGADTLRVYEMFMGPLEADKPWDDRAVQGVYRFLNKLYNLVVEALSLPEPEQSEIKLERKLHTTIKKAKKDIPALKFNTAIAMMMELGNEWQSAKLTSSSNKALFTRQDLSKVIRLLAPLAPFMAEELWFLLGEMYSVHQQSWPEHDLELTQAETIIIPVQVNGKIRGELRLSVDELESLTKVEILKQAKALDSVAKWLVDTNGEMMVLKKEIYVPGKIVSFA